MDALVAAPGSSASGSSVPARARDDAPGGGGGGSSDAAARGSASLQIPDTTRLERVAREQLAFVWRCLRRLGVPVSEADDATQQVLLVAAGKLADVAIDKERAFLYATATRVAANVRRSQLRRQHAHDALAIVSERSLDGQEELSDQLRARLLLDQVMDELPDELREAFILFEIEELPIQEIADALGIPIGTVGSRLRRARKAFQDAVQRNKKRMDFMRGVTR